MKKLIFLLLCMLICTTVQAAITLESITPANNSEITSFDFSLKFDISTAKAAFPDLADQLGVGFSGTSKKFTALYKGDEETGELIGSELTKPVTGAKEEFTIGDTFKISFADIIPEEGVKYTLVINNTFSVFSTGATKNIGTDYRFDEVPLVYTFFGKGNSVDLVQISASILKDSKLESFNDIKLTFNLPISISDNAKAKLLENDDIVANAVSFAVDPDDEKCAIISFDNIPLYKSHTYRFVCEEGSILMKDNPSLSNKEYSLSIIGNQNTPFPLKSVSPESGYNGIVTSVSVQFELPDKAEIRDVSGQSHDAVLYQKKGEELEEVAKLKGMALESADGVEFAIDYEYQPETEYVFTVPKDEIYAWTVDYTSQTGYKRISDMSNGEINIHFTTPSKYSLSALEFGVPFTEALGQRVEFPVNSEVEELTLLRMELKDKNYLYNGSEFKIKLNREGDEDLFATLYKLDESGERVKIKDVKCGIIGHNTEPSYNYVTLAVESHLYEGISYQIVIPAGFFTLNNASFKNFVESPEVVLDYTGTSDSSLSLTCTSLREGERVSSISAVSFISDRDLVPVNSSSRMYVRVKGGEQVLSSNYSIGKATYRESDGSSKTYTRVMADFSDAQKAAPAYLPAVHAQYQVVIPAGTFALENDPAITNEEIVVNIRRVSDSGVPEYVSLTSVVNHHSATVLPIEKGLKAKLQLTPSQDWKIDKVLFNDQDVTSEVAEDGSYETPEIKADSKMEVHLDYAGEIYLEDASGVAAIPETEVRVYSAGEVIKVEGLTAGENVRVYTMAGMQIADHTATDDIVTIKAAKGNVYIIVITDGEGNKRAVKIHH